MSAPAKGDSEAPRHRLSLPRKRVKKHYEFRPEIYAKLRSLRRTDSFCRVESETEAIERLINSAHDRLPLTPR
jgi:PP-loop superfamily ATP-utilizing enzyme